MKNGSSHVGELTHFPIGNGRDGDRIIHNSGICHQETGNISPVLIHVGVNGSGHKRTRDIRTASGKCMDASVRFCPVESGNDRTICSGKTFRQKAVRFLRVKSPVLVKSNDVRRIHKFVIQKSGHHQPVQILSTGSRVILSDQRVKILIDDPEFLVQGKFEIQTPDNGVIPILDIGKRPAEILSVLCLVIAVVQHICNLCIAGKPASRSGGNHKPASLIRADNLSYLLKLFCAGK